jgi:RNA polymerase sigma-70 factor (ECF subfamily)
MNLSDGRPCETDTDSIFNTYYDKIYSFILLRVKNTHDAEDIASDVFVKVVEKLDTYKPEKAAFSTWIFTIALNEIRMHYRGRRIGYSTDNIEEIADQLNIEDELLNREGLTRLYRAMSGLKDNQRKVLSLRYFGGLSNREVAEILDMSVTNVETVLYRAKIFLKKRLIDCEESDSAA